MVGPWQRHGGPNQNKNWSMDNDMNHMVLLLCFCLALLDVCFFVGFLRIGKHILLV